MKNKSLVLGFLAATLMLAPSPAAAWRPYGPPRHSYYSYGTSYHHHHHSDEVAIGVLSGIVGGVILDRIFNPPVVVQAPPYYPPPSDPYSAGYAAGYERGTMAAAKHRYRDAYRRGYEEGYYSGR